MKKMLFIYNPQSGKAQLKNKLSDVLDLFTREGFQVTVHPTQCQADATLAVKQFGEQFDYIVCSGGDGTINEVVDGIMELDDRPCIGYIPTGTVNDFAASLGLSKEIMDAANVVVKGKSFGCDVGSFNHETFTYIAAFGLFTNVAYQTSQQIKNILGRMAYLLEGAKQLSHIPAYHLSVDADGEQVEGEFIFGMVTNSTSIGGFQGLSGHDVQLDDGKFELALIRQPRNIADLHMLLHSVLNAEVNAELMYSKRASNINIVSASPIDWTLDGEYGGTETKVAIQNHYHAIQIMVSDVIE